MPYANELNPAEPAGGDQARFLDDAIRDLTNATRERLATLVEDVDADPLVLKVPAAIADNSVTHAAMADASVGTAELIDLNVTEPKLADDSVSTRTMQDNSVTNAQMADDSVGANELIDHSVGNVALGDDAVDQRVLAPNSVGSPEIIDGSVGTGEMADDSVTLAKINAALKAKLTTMVMAQRQLTQAETTINNDQYKEYDIACPGAQVGKVVTRQWSNAGAPNPVAGAGGWQPIDGFVLQAWCITADVIRIRIMNRTGATIDMGPTGAMVVVAQVQFLDGH